MKYNNREIYVVTLVYDIYLYLVISLINREESFVVDLNHDLYAVYNTRSLGWIRIMDDSNRSFLRSWSFCGCLKRLEITRLERKGGKKRRKRRWKEKKRERDGLGESWGGKGGIGGRKVTPSDTRMRNGTAFRGGRRSEWANNFASLCS